MFKNQTDAFKTKQWSGWKHFLDDFIRRESIRSAWQMSKERYDTDFQTFMDGKIAAVLSACPVSASNLLKQNGQTPAEPSEAAAEIAAGVSISRT